MEKLKRNEVFKTEFELLETVSRTAECSGFQENPLNHPFNQLLQGYKKLLQQSVRLVSISDKQQEHLHKLQSDLKNLLDNTGQGIFTVNKDLLINRGYSFECINIFGQPIEGKKFSALISPYNDVEKVILLESILNDQFFESDELQQSAMLMLLPDEISVNDRILKVTYKPVTLDLKEKLERAFMIILTNITETKAIQKAMDDEKRIFKAVTKIISDQKAFSGCVQEYRNFYQQKLSEILNQKLSTNEQIIHEVFREVHTLKGNFAIFEIPWLVDFLEEVEQFLYVMRENVAQFTFTDIQRLMSGFDFKKTLEESLNNIYRIIGSRWILEEDFIIVKTGDFKMLELDAQRVDPLLAVKMRKIRYINVREMLISYPEYTQRLADRLGKNITPFEIECSEEIKVDPEKYEEFFRSLVHVFRNMVDHGIEFPEERIDAGKEISGKIQCSVVIRDDELIITLSDDGRGMDVEKLKQAAFRQGLITLESADVMPIDQALDLVFRDGFSTSDNQNGVSGRGVGLAAVKNEIERLQGKIEIQTQPGTGTTFVFRFPFKSSMVEL